MEIKERYKMETISHSGLSALERGVRTYRSYKAREDTSTKGMNLGSAIHCKLLEPDKFQDRYLISSFEIPSGKNAEFVKTLYGTQKVSTSLFEEMKYDEEWVSNAFNVSGLKGTAQKTWDSFRSDTDTAKKLQKYWDFLEESGDKMQLALSDSETISRCEKSIEAHKKASELILGYGLSDTYEELDIVWKHPLFNFKMRSIIDRLIIDKENRTIIVVDLKTTAKNVHSFKVAYGMYRYYRQIPLYIDAAWWYCTHILKMDLTGWNIEGYIVAVQTTGHNECAVYDPTTIDKTQGTAENLKLLELMEWHFDNDKWDYPKEYYLGNGILSIQLDE